MSSRKNHQRWVWLAVGLALLLIVALLRPRKNEPRPDRIEPTLPRRMTHDELSRMRVRQTLPELAVSFDAGIEDETQPITRDPLLRALQSEAKYGVVVVEANAIRNSDLGNLIVGCMFEGSNELAKMQDAGFDPLTDLDRVAMVDDTMFVTGNFGRTNWKSEALPQLTKFGDHGRIGAPVEMNGREPSAVGVWGDSMMMFGPSEEKIKAAMNRIEGRDQSPTPGLITNELSYGEVYGVVNASAFAKMLESQNPTLAQTIRSAADRVELHLDATHDVGVVAEFKGNSPELTDDLRQSLASTLSMMRVKAVSSDDQRMAQLLEFTRVNAGANGQFQMETGLPYGFLKGELEKCIANKKERALRGPRDGDGGDL